MAKISRYNQGPLESAVTGTPGLDSSGLELATGFARNAGNLANAAQSAWQKNQNIANQLIAQGASDFNLAARQAQHQQAIFAKAAKDSKDDQQVVNFNLSLGIKDATLSRTIQQEYMKTPELFAEKYMEQSRNAFDEHASATGLVDGDGNITNQAVYDKAFKEYARTQEATSKTLMDKGEQVRTKNLTQEYEGGFRATHIAAYEAGKTNDKAGVEKLYEQMKASRDAARNTLGPAIADKVFDENLPKFYKQYARGQFNTIDGIKQFAYDIDHPNNPLTKLLTGDEKIELRDAAASANNHLVVQQQREEEDANLGTTKKALDYFSTLVSEDVDATQAINASYQLDTLIQEAKAKPLTKENLSHYRDLVSIKEKAIGVGRGAESRQIAMANRATAQQNAETAKINAAESKMRRDERYAKQKAAEAAKAKQSADPALSLSADIYSKIDRMGQEAIGKKGKIPTFADRQTAHIQNAFAFRDGHIDKEEYQANLKRLAHLDNLAAVKGTNKQGTMATLSRLFGAPPDDIKKVIGDSPTELRKYANNRANLEVELRQSPAWKHLSPDEDLPPAAQKVLDTILKNRVINRKLK